MNIQGNNVDQTPYKIVFSNILCKIKINEQGVYGLIIRLGTYFLQHEGKKSSKYSDKKPIHNGALQLNNILEVPFDGRVFSNQNIRRDKCEIMMYRYKTNGERETKELIGMASLGVGNQLFQQQIKKLRLTNSTDKQAFIQCKVKIQLGDADILSVNESKMSSFFFKSNQNSTVNEMPNLIIKQIQSKNETNVGLITSNSQKSISVASQSIKEDNSLLQILTSNSPQNNFYNKTDKSLSKSDSQIISVTQPTVGSQEILNSNKQFQHDKNNLLSVCTDLQKQNQLLISKIENLQNQLFNQSILSNSSINDRPQIPRPPGSIKKSPMIKKNTTITVTPTFQKQSKEFIQLQNDQNQRQLITQKSAGSLYSYKTSQIRANESRKIDQISSPYFSNKNPSQEVQVLAKIEQSQVVSHMTFGGQKFFRKNYKLSINNVIGVIYKPPLNSRRNRHQISYNERQNSITNQSVSDIERKHERSYSKFSGKKKYQVIGTIKSPDQSQNLSYLQHQSNENHDKKNKSVILSKSMLNQQNEDKIIHKNQTQKQSPFNILKGQTQTPKGNIQSPNFFLNFLNENQEQQNSFGLNINQAFQGILKPADSKQNILPIQNKNELDFYNKSRVTLEELDMKTEERFRKNERALKIANMKILEENIVLKKQKKSLQELIQTKKQLSHQQFYNLRSQIKALTQQVEKNKNLKLQSESKLTELLNRCKNLDEENSRLKKEIKQQKTKYEYYLKISNINDHKDKQKDLKKGSQNSIHSKRTSIQKDSQIFNSIVESGKSASKNQQMITSIMNISNKEEPNKRRSIMIDSKSLKKVDFTLEDKTFDEIKLSNSYYEKKPEQNNRPNIPKPSSSFAVSRLKQQLKSGIQRNKDESVSMTSSPMNNSFSGSGFGLGFTGGLIGTGDTIIQNNPNVFSSFGQK